jgi:hypothetical protein
VEGEQGDQGPVGGLSLLYTFDTQITAPPASGETRYDNTTPASVTEIYVSDTDRNGADMDATLDTVAVGDTFRIFDVTDPSKFLVVTVDSNTDSGTYHTFGVTVVSENSTIADDADIAIGWSVKGDKGDTGDTGATGATGGWTLFYDFSTDTGEDPTSGEIEYNNATPSSVTEIYVHDTDRNGAALDGLLDTFAAGDSLRLFEEGTYTNFAIYTISAASDEGDYHKFTVSHVASNGTFGDGDDIGLSWTEKGDTGSPGSEEDMAKWALVWNLMFMEDAYPASPGGGGSGTGMGMGNVNI